MSNVLGIDVYIGDTQVFNSWSGIPLPATLDDLYDALKARIVNVGNGQYEGESAVTGPCRMAIANGDFNICVRSVQEGTDKKKTNFLVGTDGANPSYWPLQLQTLPTLSTGVTLVTGITWCGGRYSPRGGSIRTSRLLNEVAGGYAVNKTTGEVAVVNTYNEMISYNQNSAYYNVKWGVAVQLVFSDPRSIALGATPSTFTVNITPQYSTVAPFDVSIPRGGSTAYELLAGIKTAHPGEFDTDGVADIKSFCTPNKSVDTDRMIYNICANHALRKPDIAYKFYIAHNQISGVRLQNMAITTKVRVGNIISWINDDTSDAIVNMDDVLASRDPLMEIAMSGFMTMDPKASNSAVLAQIASMIAECQASGRNILDLPDPPKLADGYVPSTLKTYAAALGSTMPYYATFQFRGQPLRYAIVTPSDEALKIPYFENAGVLTGTLDSIKRPSTQVSALADNATIELFPLPTLESPDLYTWFINVAFLQRKGLWRTVNVQVYSNWTVLDLAMAVKTALVDMPVSTGYLVNGDRRFNSSHNSPADRTKINNIVATSDTTNATFMTDLGNVKLTDTLMNTPAAYQEALVFMTWGKGTEVTPPQTI
jgi:hypothetical protein